MQSVIIAAKNITDRQAYREKLIRNISIDIFDVTTLDEANLGIEEIRNVQKTIFLKPLKSDYKAVVLQSAHTLSAQAQNALLKVLEEPPEDTLIILETEKIELLLPTILSRCKIIVIKEPKDSPSKENLNDPVVPSLFSMGIGKKLQLAQDKGKTREEACDFLEKLIIEARQIIKSVHFNDINKHLELLKVLQKTYTIIKTTNVQPRFALENLFLSL